MTETVSDRAYKLLAHISSPDDLKIIDDIQALEEEIKSLKQAIQNTLDTGMDRYIREAIND
jgi:nucleoside-triphosphatase THEP1